ncbi:paraquat-inducible protein B [Syntrophus gentianae]|uniref:Paraquat-inducible protein B n=1 Tax=Syntrophus gentianae TaxID=43775 RepID=A0A1H7VY68_9BACT|nr:MlaD family protein [Syntrophus gentianae]SEM13715.1 paraquat-inducible protein B [Syntrophus gentianae]
MTDSADLNNLPQATAKPKKKMRFSVVWIIPVVAALVGLGIAIQQILSQGPTITIIFKKAEGVEAGKTLVKYKDVNIGRVETVELSKDYTKVVVTAKINKSAAGLVVEDAKFWVEQPRVTLSGVSGIGTLLSGNHIGLELGKSTKARRQFVGLEAPPAIAIDQPGRQFVLQADNIGSVGIGSPLYYRRLNVGRVIGYDLAKDGRSIDIKVFVNAPYDKHVTPQTRFWHASGIDFSLGANGLSVQTQSVVSMLVGGISFEIFSSVPDATPAAEDAVFKLYGNYAAAAKEPDTIVTDYVLFFQESLRGLSVGAPVTYLGLPVGEVTRVGLEYNPKTEGLRPRVDVSIYQNRFMAHLMKSATTEQITRSEPERRAFVQRLVDLGLRAQLRSGNLVTGQLYVALERFPNAPKVKLDWTHPPYAIPVMPGSLQDLETKVNGILAKVEKIPLDAIGEEAKKTLITINSTMKAADRTLTSVNGEIVPEVKTTVQDLRKAIATAERVLVSTDNTLVGKEAPAQQELRVALQEMARAARAISELAEYLERHPDALIRGKAQEVPK